MIDDDKIIQLRINGKSVRAIAKACGTSVAEVNRVLDLWFDQTITDKVRKHTLTLELARLDELQQTFYAPALAGDVQCGALVTKIIERRGVMLGLHVPQTAVLWIVEEATPKETSTDKPERALNALIEDQKCGKSARCVRRGGDWKRGTVERSAGAPVLDPTEVRALAEETPESPLPLHSDAIVMAQSDRDLVFHSAKPVAERRIVHNGCGLAGAPRCVHLSL